MPREAEPNQPGSYLDYLWVQVSDLADWRTLAACAHAVWAAQNDTTGLASTPGFAKPDTIDAAAILGLIRRVQDGFRYLSMDLETSGWVPSSPGVVARRRHGDCKDLAWLAASVLRVWGVSARPVLVGAGLRERVGELLPMAMVFNHAILEVEHAGERRWFDLTCRDLGGDFSRQTVGWFGRGLVLHDSEGGLTDQPGRRPAAKYELRETVLLDTNRGAVSMLELRVRCSGWHADELRRVWLAQGAENFWRERDEMAKRRHGRTKRVGEGRWRDDREANVCELAEVFELAEAVYPDERGQRALFDAPPSLVAQTFLLPEDKPRRGPWDMPFPYEIAHEVVVKSASLGLGSGPRRRWAEPEFDAALECLRVRGVWTNRVRFRVGAPIIGVERLPEYRRRLESCFRDLGWRIFLPWGQGRVRRGEGFGELVEPGVELVRGADLGPATGTAVPAVAAASSPVAAAEPALARVVPLAKSAEELKRPPGGRRRRQREVAERRRRGEFSFDVPSGLTRWCVRYGWIVLVGFFVVRFWLRRLG